MCVYVSGVHSYETQPLLTLHVCVCLHCMCACAYIACLRLLTLHVCVCVSLILQEYLLLSHAKHVATHCNTLQHTATHCNTLKKTDIHPDTDTDMHTHTHNHTLGLLPLPIFQNIYVTFQEIYGSFAKALQTAKYICKVYARNTFSEYIFKMHSRHGSLSKYIGLFSGGIGLFAGNIVLFSEPFM